MLRSTTAYLLVFAILSVSLTLPVTAQQQQQIPAKEPIATAVKNETAGPDMREVFAKQTEEVRADAAVFDPVKAERERGNQQAQKKGWSKTKKTLVIAAVVVGIAALTFLMIKYYRKCIRYSEYCNIDPNTGLEDCPCEEYEQKDK